MISHLFLLKTYLSLKGKKKDKPFFIASGHWTKYCISCPASSPTGPTQHPETEEETPSGLLFLFTKTLLSDMLDKKKLQPQSSYAKMIEEHAVIFHTSRTFNEFFF